MKTFNNQFATQKLRQEMSVTGTGASFTPGTGEQAGPVATKKIVKKKLKPEVKDVEPKLAAGKAKVYMKDKWGWKDAPSIPNRPSKGGFIYKQLFEELSAAVNEASVPENIVKFARKKGATSIVNTVANWAEKAGKKIIGGTAIGKNYDTLVLDLTHQGSEIYINVDTDAVEVNGKSVRNYNDFIKALEIQDINQPEEQGDNEDNYDWFTNTYTEEIKHEDKVKIVDSENMYFGRTGKVHDIHDDNTAMIIVDAPGNPTTTIDISKLKSISEINEPEEEDDYGSDNPDDDYGPIQESYSKFKTETKTRGKSDQFHQAVRQVRKKVQEINKLFEYVSRLKSELSEGEDGLKYKIHTERALEKIKEMVSELNQNIKKFK